MTTEDVGPFRPEAAPDLADVRRGIVERTNEFRESKNGKPVETNEPLHATAQAFAEYMAKHDRYGHTADDRTPAQRARAREYAYCLVSENIAYQFRTTGFETAELTRRFVQGWKDSPGHRRNMLREEVVETGVGVARSETTGIVYAVQMFGRPKSLSISFTVLNDAGRAVPYSVGDRVYELPERYRRQHEICSPTSLRLGGKETDEDEPAGKPISIEDEARYRVVDREGTLAIERGE